MAEECVDVPMITEATMSRVVGLRRHSAGKGSSGSNEGKVVPHYLRASTGSCHDFCKYGRKLALEVEERSSIPKRAERKPLHQSFDGIIISVSKNRASVDSEPTKISGVKCSGSVDSEHQISDASGTIELEQPTKVSEVLVNKNKTSLVRVKPSILLQKSNISSTSKTRRQEIPSSSKVDTTSKPTSKRVRASSISAAKKEGPLLKSTSERVKTHPKSTSQVVKTSSKSTSKKTRASLKLSSFKDKEMNLSEKHVTSLNLDSCKVASPLRASWSSKSFGKRLGGINMHKSLKTVSQVMNQSKATEVEPEEHNNEVQEKTLYVIKIETENQTFQSDQNASQDIELSISHSLSSPKFSSSVSEFSSQEYQVESEYATSEFEEDSSSGKHGKEYMENLETLEVEENGKPQKDVDVPFEDQDCQKPSGKLVETQIEKISPKRLKFRRGKVLEDSAINVKVDTDNIGAIIGPEKVVLRHQDVKGKKDGQMLLNNVIEETASKLVEIQKSKVKALVDAFETIISLQEKKNYAANNVH